MLAGHLVEQTSRLVRGKTASRDNIVEELSPRHVLHNDKYIWRGIDDLVPKRNEEIKILYWA